MFSLIITVISIVMVVALAIATLYYGGTAFSQGSSRTAAATVVAHAQQVAGANLLYSSDNNGSFSTNISGLHTGGYLSAVPTVLVTTAGAFSVNSSNVVSATIASEEICRQINRGSTGNAVSSLPTGTTAQYGCAVTPLAFTYKG